MIRVERKHLLVEIRRFLQLALPVMAQSLGVQLAHAFRRVRALLNRRRFGKSGADDKAVFHGTTLRKSEGRDEKSGCVLAARAIHYHGKSENSTKSIFFAKP